MEKNTLVTEAPHCIPEPEITEESYTPCTLQAGWADFSERSSAPGSEAAQDKWLLQKKSFFENKFCPRQRSCPGQVASSTNKSVFEKKFCPRQRSCPGQVVCSKKSLFLRKVLPQAAKLPGIRGLLKKNKSNFEK